MYSFYEVDSGEAAPAPTESFGFGDDAAPAEDAAPAVDFSASYQEQENTYATYTETTTTTTVTSSSRTASFEQQAASSRHSSFQASGSRTSSFGQSGGPQIPVIEEENELTYVAARKCECQRMQCVCQRLTWSIAFSM